MVVILSTAQIVQKTIEFYRNSQPLLDTKPGTVARDLFIDCPAVRLAELYEELNRISTAQSIAKSLGSDLDNLVSNFGEDRFQPGRAVGPAVFTFSSISSDIPIPSGTIIYAKGGVSFRTLNNVTVREADEDKYVIVATKYRADLDFLGNTDRYAVEVLTECTTVGVVGNISKYSLISTGALGVSAVTNVTAFTGGTPQESEGAYKNRIISVFSGSNTGTELGYINVVETDPATQSAVVVGPGDPLMLRDNTIIKYDMNGDPELDDNGDPIVLSEGGGGKVDIFIQGIRLSENIESYIYNDQSGQNDATNEKNDFVIGQIPSLQNASFNKKRRLAIKNKTLPYQPVYNLIEVTGSRSGIFSQQIMDQFGRKTGNYNLIKDTGVYGGSVFGFDKLKWINNYTTIEGEDLTKTIFNGQDQLSFTDLLKINNIRRTITVTNENSKINQTDRSIVNLSHTPIRNIIRVLNVTTGERYTVSNRNPDGFTGSLNLTGNIIISGNALPSVSDVLQIDYEWVFYHDTYVDFDSKTAIDNIRNPIDSVDWGYCNVIRREESFVEEVGGVQSVSSSLPISSVVTVNKLAPIAYSKTVEESGSYLRINLPNTIKNIVSIKKSTTNVEVYNTYKGNGYFDGANVYLPTDSSAQAGDLVDVYYNAINVFTINGVSGSFSEKKINLLPEAKTSLGLADGDFVEINYIANINEFLPTTDIVNLPAIINENSFDTLNSSKIGHQPTTNVGVLPIIVKNLRKSPSKLAINFSGIVSPGVLVIKGITSNLLENVVFTATTNGLTQDLSQAIKSGLGLEDSETLSENIKISKLVKLEHVETISSDIVINKIKDFDIIGYSLKDASYNLDEAISNSSLSKTEISLPTTTDNISFAPLAGQKLRAAFYVIDEGANQEGFVEELSVSTNGVIYTDESFARIFSISVASGFKLNNIYFGAITVSPMNQPSAGSRYKVSYDFSSPKPGERIDIRYNYNSLIGDSTIRLEPVRQITADTLLKESPYILIDVGATIIVKKEYLKSSNLVLQNVADQIASTINNQKQGSTLHASDLTNAAYQVTGLDSIRINTFNREGRIGQVLQIQAMRNQYLRANTITVSFEP